MSLYNLYKQSELHTGLEITLFKSGEGVIILWGGSMPPPPFLCVDIHTVSYEGHLRSERHILLWDHLLYNTISYSKVRCTKHHITV